MKTKTILATAVLLAIASTANAGNVSLDNKDGDYVYVESADSSDAPMYAVVAVLEKTGYNRQKDALDIPQGIKVDTWCKVQVQNEREVTGECYTPHQGQGIAVRDHVVTFNGDYSKVPDMIAQLRDKHRRASALLGIK